MQMNQMPEEVHQLKDFVEKTMFNKLVDFTEKTMLRCLILEIWCGVLTVAVIILLWWCVRISGQ